MREEEDMVIEESKNMRGTGDDKVKGCVKFFNKTKGYGFINVLKNEEYPEFSEKDIFVHFSAINNENNQYKFLVKGEYVEFKIALTTKNNNDKELYIALEITGIQGGKLMCESNYNEYVSKMNKSYYMNNELSNDDMDITPIKLMRETGNPYNVHYSNRSLVLPKAQYMENVVRNNVKPNVYSKQQSQLEKEKMSILRKKII